MRKCSRSVLLKNRDEKVKERFNYWYEKKRLRYDDTLTKLSGEFFLAEFTIERILKGSGRYSEPKPAFVQKTIFDAIEENENGIR